MQDGHEGNLGTVTNIQSWGSGPGSASAGAAVQWDEGSSNVYRWGYNDKWDLKIASDEADTLPSLADLDLRRWPTWLDSWVSEPGAAAVMEQLGVSRKQLVSLCSDHTVPERVEAAKEAAGESVRGTSTRSADDGVAADDASRELILRLLHLCSKDMLAAFTSISSASGDDLARPLEAAVNALSQPARRGTVAEPAARATELLAAVVRYRLAAFCAAVDDAYELSEPARASAAVAAVASGGAGGGGGGSEEAPPPPPLRQTSSVGDKASTQSPRRFVLRTLLRDQRARAFIAVASAVLDQARQVCDAAAAAFRGDEEPRLPVAKLDRLLHSSFVGQVVPLVTIGLAGTGRCLPIALYVLPKMVQCAQSFGNLASYLPGAVAAEERLLAAETTFVTEEGRTGDSSGSAAPRYDESVSVHWALDLVKSFACVGGSMAGCLIAAPPEHDEEEALSAWLKCCAISGGLESKPASVLRSPASNLRWDDPSAGGGSGTGEHAWLGPVVDELVDLIDEPESIPLVRRGSSGSARSGSGLPPATLITHARLGIELPDDKVVAVLAPEMTGTVSSGDADRDAIDSGKLLQAVFDDEAWAEGGAPEDTRGAATLLLEWFNSHHKEHPLQARQGTFPAASRAYLAVALKHTGAWREVLEWLRGGAESKDAPSDLLRSVWMSVRELRRHLRTQKMLDKKGLLAAALAGEDFTVSHTSGSSDGAEETKADSTASSSAGVARTVTRREVNAVASVVLPLDVATSIAGAESLVIQRCAMLLQFAQASRAARAAAPSDAAASQLAEKWSALLPPPTLQPLLTRWRSEGGALGMVDISGDSDRDGTADTLRQCLMFVSWAADAPPRVLLGLVCRREVRAAVRAAGLRAMLALLKSLPGQFATAQRDALLHLRPAMRGAVAWTRDDASSGEMDPSKVRHHYMKGLEGCSTEASDAVQAAFIELYVHLSGLLAKAVAQRDTVGGHVCMLAFALDLQPSDHEFLLRVGLVSSLHALFSLEAASRDATAEIGASKALRSHSTVIWTPWPLSYVRRALTSGTLTKREVIKHMKDAPASKVPAAVRAAHKLETRTRILVAELSISQLLALYESFLSKVVSTSTGGIEDGAPPAPALERQNSDEADVHNADPSVLGTELSHAVGSATSAFVFKGRGGVAQRCLRDAAWALFQLIAAGAAGARRGLYLRPGDADGVRAPHDGTGAGDGARTTTRGEGQPPPGSAAAVAASAERAARAAAAADGGQHQASGGVDEGTRRYTAQLRELAFHALLSELHTGARRLHGAARGGTPLDGSGAAHSADADSLASLEVGEVEATVAGLLRFVLSTIDLPGVRQALAQPTTVSSLADFLQSGSPRVRRLALRLLPDVVAHLPPASIELPEGSAVRSGGGLLATILDGASAAECVLCTDDAPTSLEGSIADPVGVGAGHVILGFAGDCVSALRRIAALPEWRSAVARLLIDAICDPAVTALASTGAADLTPANRRAAGRAAAAFAVMGGHEEIVRVGVSAFRGSRHGVGDVVSPAAAATASVRKGTIVAASPVDPVARVVFDPQLPPESVDVDTLLPLSQPAPQPSHFAEVAADEGVRAQTLAVLTTASTDIGSPPVEREASAAGRGASDSGGDETTAVSSVTLAQAWVCTIKARCTAAQPALLQLGDYARWFARECGTALTQAALTPADLPNLVATRFVSSRSAYVRQALYEWSRGVRIGAPVERAAGPAAESETDRKRRLAAENLAAMGFEVDLCVAGLKLFDDNEGRVVEWLLSGEGQVFKDGGGLQQEKADESERFKAARQLGTIVGLAPRLCESALQVFSDDSNHAMNLLLERGSVYAAGMIPAGAAVDERRAAALAAHAAGADDSAVLDDLDLGEAEPLIADDDEAEEARVAAAFAAASASSGAAAGGAGGGAMPGDSETKTADIDGDTPGPDAPGATRTVLSLGHAGGASVGARSARGHGAVTLSTVAGDAPQLLHGGSVVTVSADTGEVWRPRSLTGVVSSDTRIPSGGAEPASVRVDFLDLLTGATAPESFPSNLLCRHSHLFGSRVTSVGDLVHQAAFADSVLALHWARVVVITMLASPDIPSVSIASLGPERFVTLLKLVAASEHALSGGRDPLERRLAKSGGRPAPGQLMDALEALMQAHLLEEGGVSGGDSGGSPLPRFLVGQVATNMLAATSPGVSTEYEMRESLHPHYHACTYTDSVACVGARALWITFDPMCSTAEGAQLVFHAGPDAGSGVLLRCGGPEASNAFRSFVVHSDVVHFSFRSRCDPDAAGANWGYRFFVSEMQGLAWLREGAAVDEPSLEWACYLLEFLLNEASALVARGMLHDARVFDAMTSFLRARGTPFKHHVLGLLTQLLKRPQLFDARSPPALHALSGVEHAVMAHCDREIAEHASRGDGRGLVFPSRLLQLLELLTTKRAAERALIAQGARWVHRGGARAPKLRGCSVVRERVDPEGEGPLSPRPVPHDASTASRSETSSMSLMDVLVDAMDITECIFFGFRLPDALLSRIMLDAGYAGRAKKRGDGATAVSAESMEHCLRVLASWTPAMDAELVQFVTTITAPTGGAIAGYSARGGSGGASAATASSDAPLAVGDRVRVRASVTEPRHGWGPVTSTSVGVISDINLASSSCTVNFPEHSTWTGAIDEMERLPREIVIGSRVRVRRSVTSPTHGFGSVTHDSVGEVATIHGADCTVNFPEQRGWSGVLSELEHAPSGSISVGSRVRVRRSVESPAFGFGSVTHDSVGTVASITGPNCTVDFPEQPSWSGVVAEMELVDGPAPSGVISVGSRVRVRRSVESPAFGFGSVTHDSVGTIVSITGPNCTVNFPEHSSWSGVVAEMELVDGGAAAVAGESGPAFDFARSSGSASEETLAKRREVTDGAGDPLLLDPSRLAILAEEDGLTFQLLNRQPVESLRLRFALLRLFNSRLARVMPLLDIMNAGSTWAMGHKLRALGHCIFLDIKASLLQAALDKTWLPQEGSGLSITLDNSKAFASQVKAERDPAAATPGSSQCLFVQAFHALAHHPANLFRARLDSRERLFQVSFRGEDGTDWGGLYRDCLSQCVDDLASPHLDLFVPTPNARRGEGDSRDRVLPNPRHAASGLAHRMYTFVGRLLGIALRHRNYLPFSFPSLVWKRIAGVAPSATDLTAIDGGIAALLDTIEDVAKDAGVTQAEFDEQFNGAMGGKEGAGLPAAVIGCDGRVVDLAGAGCEGGDRVTVAGAAAYVKAARSYRLHEFDAACSAMRAGLVSLVPERALRLLTWRELELSICGDPVVDVDELKRHTTYHGWTESDPGVRRFWKVFDGLTNEERSKFVRFVWGRARLPKPSQWSRPFKLTKKNGGDDQLPLAHTCFFQVEMPAYSSEEVMRRRIIAAISYGSEFLIA